MESKRKFWEESEEKYEKNFREISMIWGIFKVNVSKIRRKFKKNQDNFIVL